MTEQKEKWNLQTDHRISISFAVDLRIILPLSNNGNWPSFLS